jgi:hypothetical protein
MDSPPPAQIALVEPPAVKAVEPVGVSLTVTTALPVRPLLIALQPLASVTETSAYEVVADGDTE